MPATQIIYLSLSEIVTKLIYRLNATIRTGLQFGIPASTKDWSYLLVILHNC